MRVFFIILLIFFSFFSQGQTKLTEIYLGEVGVTEATNNNDGKRVNEYQRTTNTIGLAWCSSFLRWCFDSAAIKTIINAWSPTAFNSKNIVYYEKKFRKIPQADDVFTLYSLGKKRIFHAGFVYKVLNSRFYISVEGNVQSPYSRKEGVFKKKRRFKSTYGITRW